MSVNRIVDYQGNKVYLGNPDYIVDGNLKVKFKKENVFPIIWANDANTAVRIIVSTLDMIENKKTFNDLYFTAYSAQNTKITSTNATVEINNNSYAQILVYFSIALHSKASSIFGTIKIEADD